jgi:hypothetical protein
MEDGGENGAIVSAGELLFQSAVRILAVAHSFVLRDGDAKPIG